MMFVSVLGKVAEYTAAPVLRQFGYLIHYESNVEDLTGQVLRLADKRDGVQLAVVVATRNLETIAPEVETWLRNVDDIIQEKNTCFEIESIAKATCSNGWFPNLKFRHSLGRKAKKMTLVVDKLLGDGNFTTISYPASPPEIGFSSIQHSQAVAKLHEGASSSGTSNPAPPPSSPLKLPDYSAYRMPCTFEMLNALQDDRISMIGICGIIKGRDTETLSDFIYSVVKQEFIFEEVVVDIVSQNPDVKQIQDRIADKLGLNLKNGSLLERAEILHARISKETKRILLILFDVHKILHLEAVGIPYGDSITGCKIILMSRHPTVFSIKMRTQRNFKLFFTSSSIGDPIGFESRNSIINEVMTALVDDDINPIVICGMGGIGKTTLVKEVGKRAKAWGLFDEVAMAVLTQNPDLSHIQDEIADFLGLELRGRSLFGRASKLCERLSGNKRVLVILDNVCEPLNLEEVGIPFGYDQKGCKILVTSRMQDIFNEVQTKKNFAVGGLLEEEAWSLFEKVVRSTSDPEFYKLHSIAKQVVSECAGLPIAISTVGRALDHKSEQRWKDALAQLRNACPESIPGMIQNVYRKIELSYECLESEEAKSFFLLCCLYPENGDIPVEDLVRYGLGLRLFKGIDSMIEGRNRVEALVDILKSSFLLLDGNKEGCVTMHDIVHGVALWIIESKIKDGFMVRYGVELKDWPKNGVAGQYSCTLRNNNHLTELLLLSCTDKYSPKPLSPTIFTGMDLIVLHIKSTFVLTILPSLPSLKNLQTLCLEHCHFDNASFKILNTVLRKLETLEMLSLRGSHIEQLPDALKHLSKLRLLDLTGCSGLSIISQGVISRLAQLEELYMWDGFEQCVVGGQTTKPAFQGEIKELLSLCCLTTLEIVLPPIDNLQLSPLFHKLERFKISIGRNMDRKEDVHPFENYLRLHDLDATSLVGSGIPMLLKITDTLDLKMKNLRDVLNALDTNCCMSLKTLMLNDCHALEFLIDLEGIHMERTPRSVFPVLNSLEIQGAIELKEICRGELPTGSLKELRYLFLSGLPLLTHLWRVQTPSIFMGNLRHAKVHSCDALESVFILGEETNDLKQLEELDIQHCQSLEQIVALGRQRHARETDEIKFPSLIRLHLRDLPRLVGLSKKISKMNFPQLFTLTLEHLPELTGLYPNYENRWSPESSRYYTAPQHLIDTQIKSFSELRFMVVTDCAKLSDVFSSNLVQNLQNLEHLEVRKCKSLQTVFDLEDPEITEKDAPATLSCLEKMELTDLPMLAYLWDPPQNILAFQNLRMLQVMRCESLRYVFTRFIFEGLVKLESMYISDCAGMEDIVAKSEGGGEATKKLTLPQVKTLHLDDLPNLITFCPAPCTVEWPSLRTWCSAALK